MTYSKTRPKKYMRFPNSWNETWVREGATDLEKAKAILRDFSTKDESDEAEKKAVERILSTTEIDGNLNDVAALATAVQLQVFRNQHTVLKATWLLQRMRFILLKCRTNLPESTHTDDLMRFFFDISMPSEVEGNNTMASERMMASGRMVALELPDSMLKVVIVGGGPAGLSAAIKLAELVDCPKRVQIHVYDKRWTNCKHGQLNFTAYAGYERRRNQVITLQDHVKNLLSKNTKTFLDYGLGNRGAEVVWPESSNLKISKVEDALLKRAQDSAFDGLIHLHGVNISDEPTLIREAGEDFHLLLGTDGANSWIRRHYFAGDADQPGKSFALGVAIQRRSRDLPRSQALNIFLTLCQTRFLLNASDRDGTCYMNMLLTKDEYEACVRGDGVPADFGSPAYIPEDGDGSSKLTPDTIFAPYRDKSNLWHSISDGLKLFGFEENEVKSIVRIPINLIAVNTATKKMYLHSPTRLHPHYLVSLAGDSALTHHFWPGRGMNSGIKAAIAWSFQVANLILDRNERFVGLKPSVMNPFLNFMERLTEREHARRSMVIIKKSGSPERMLDIVTQARKRSEHDQEVDTILCERVRAFAERFEGRGLPHWPHKPEPIKELLPDVLNILAKLDVRTKAEMYMSGPWPTKDMSGDEVIPRKPGTLNQNGFTMRDEYHRHSALNSMTHSTSRDCEIISPWPCPCLTWFILLIIIHWFVIFK